MRKFTAARYVIANDAFCAVAEETPESATAQWERLLARHDVIAEDSGTTARLALVDNAESPTCWSYVSEYYRVRHVLGADATAMDAASRYHIGEGANIFEEKDAAIETARSLDDLGDEWDMEVVAFDDVTGSGRVVWGS